MSLGDILFETVAEMMGIPVRRRAPERRPPPRPPDDGPLAFPDEVDEVAWSDAETEDDPPTPTAAETSRDPHPDRQRPIPVAPAERLETSSAPSPDKTRAPGAPSALVADLRRDPAAARKAFLYGEIFGPPLADREDHAR